MMLWAVIGVLLLAVVLALLAPLVRRSEAAPADRSEHGFEVLRDQLAEVERDRASGRLDAESAAAARLEIERRLLAEAERGGDEAAAEASAAGSTRRRRLLAAVLVLLAVPTGSIGLYLAHGRPGLPDAPLASRSAERTRMAEIAESRRGLMEMAADLERRLAEQPGDVEGWSLLGRTRLTLGDGEAAVEAFRRAIVAGGGDGQAFAQLGEALVRVNDGVVGEEARRAFEQALAKMPGEPRSRFYLGLASRQAGDIDAALRRWLELEAETPPDAPWRQMLTGRIEEAARAGGADLAALRARLREERGQPPGPPPAQPGPTAGDMAAADAMAPDDRLAMIQGMVDGLAARLQSNPDDLDGWRRLGRSYLVLNRRADAIEAYRRAAELAPEDTEVQLDYAHALFPPGTAEREMPPAFAEVIARVRAIDPDNAEGLFFGGLIAARGGDTATARELWRQLITKLPPDSPVRAAVQRRIDALPAP